VSVLPKPLYLFLMLRFVGIKVFDKVCRGKEDYPWGTGGKLSDAGLFNQL